MNSSTTSNVNPIQSMKKTIRILTDVTDRIQIYKQGFEKRVFHFLKQSDHGRTKYGMATLFQIDQATFICRQ